MIGVYTTTVAAGDAYVGTTQSEFCLEGPPYRILYITLIATIDMDLASVLYPAPA